MDVSVLPGITLCKLVKKSFAIPDENG
jgi:hypothetical protein